MIHPFLNLIVQIHQFAVVSSLCGGVGFRIADYKGVVIRFLIQTPRQVFDNRIRCVIYAVVLKHIAAVRIGNAVKEIVHGVRKAFSQGSVDLPALQILGYHLRTIISTIGADGIRLPVMVVVDPFNLAVLQIDVFISQLVKTIIVASNGVFPGHVHMIPVPVQLHQIPGVRLIVHIPHLQAAGLGSLKESVRITCALGLSLDNTAVGCRIFPALSFFILAVLHQPLDDHDLLFKIAHIIGDILILEILDGRLCLSPLIGIHLGEISVLKIVDRVFNGSIGVIIPLRITVSVRNAVGAGTAAGARTTGTGAAAKGNAIGCRTCRTLSRYGRNPFPRFINRISIFIHPRAVCVHRISVRRSPGYHQGATLSRVQVVTLSIDPLPAGHHGPLGTAYAGIQKIPAA